MDFEIAIKHIHKGDEITNDYGTLNIIEAFQCAKGPHEREFVKPDDLKSFSGKWDLLIQSAMQFQTSVNQPLSRYLSTEQLTKLSDIRLLKKSLPSILENYFDER